MQRPEFPMIVSCLKAAFAPIGDEFTDWSMNDYGWSMNFTKVGAMCLF
jgi:hypothetical protein